jgi:hypothetical protein
MAQDQDIEALEKRFEATVDFNDKSSKYNI